MSKQNIKIHKSKWLVRLVRPLPRMKTETVPHETSRITRKLSINFPFPVAQVDPHTVQVVVDAYQGPVIHEAALKAIAGELSPEQQDRLVDDVQDFLQSEAIRRAIRVS